MCESRRFYKQCILIHSYIENKPALKHGRGKSNTAETTTALGQRPTRLPVVLAQRLFANGAQRRGRRDGFGIDLDMQDRGFARALRGREGRREIGSPLDRRPKPAEGARI